MENNNTEKLDEDIRQHKLYKIQVNEQKIREYKNVFNTIKESTIVKNSKNISSYIVRFIFRLITILLIIICLIVNEIKPGYID
jgi:serine/threonine-protein kinase RIO1